MTKKQINLLDKHRNHPIEIIDEEVVINSDLLSHGLIHAGRIMCKKCKVQIKWASRDEIDYYRSSSTKQYDTSSYDNFKHHMDAVVYEQPIKHMQDDYYKKYAIPANGTYNIYLNVKYAEKDEVKKLGAKWDQEKKKWFVNSHNPKAHALAKWMNSQDVDRLMNL